MPRPNVSAETIDTRRHLALRLLDQGYSLNEVGRMIDSAPSSVMRWRDARDRGREKALKVRFSPGRPAKLTNAQRRTLVQWLLKGAIAAGISTELWTSARVARLIEKHYHVQFHRSHVARLLHELGFSCQKPERRALARDEEKIEESKRKRWPQEEEDAARLGATSSLSTNPAS